ncbi:STAS domain-containing protein [Actinokineospora guangxiensis]|uniref:Anti-sigma factor antagonist n=1 Tax=Actinokineospora guangxiensis TaxID=1490288 RepID=A0ABW0ERF3_9PSEU
MSTKAHDPPLDQDPLRISVSSPDGDTVVVTVDGELDLATAGVFEAHLTEALATGRARIVVDLTGVSFLGVAGITELLRVRDRAAGRRAALRVVAAHRAVLRPLLLLDLVPGLPVHPTLASALSPLPHPRC